MDGDPSRTSGDPRATYDAIAEHFAATREYPWPEVESFVTETTTDEQAASALDLGCANGRHCELLSGHAAAVVGLDVSRELLGEARKRATERGFAVSLVHGDAARLPFRAESFDLAVYVATLHHLTTREARVDSLDELARVLRPGGRALVSAWSTEHGKFDESEGFDTTVDWTLPGGERVPRFYHIYDPDEFRDDLDTSGLAPVDVFVSSGNCYAVVE
ncbi:class I SAM-dependent methyltransferase [Haloprofundus salinisoli]|uniref:class I SAM-dependent methyltransferase n=1 Tax=Haloprofundus salinisoli TaxID=2876193 RepID=UPI001CC9BD2F|nr:class I SAM-dependent methyltransferase [Haloprofundus salinisoli]